MTKPVAPEKQAESKGPEQVRSAILALIKRQRKHGTTTVEVCQALGITADTCRAHMRVLAVDCAIGKVRGLGNGYYWYAKQDLKAGREANAAEIKAASLQRDRERQKKKAKWQVDRQGPASVDEGADFADEIDRDPVTQRLLSASEAKPIGAVGPNSVFDLARWAQRKSA